MIIEKGTGFCSQGLGKATFCVPLIEKSFGFVNNLEEIKCL